MLAGDKSERHRRAQRGTWPRVASAKHIGLIIAYCIEAGDRLRGAVQHACPPVRPKTRKGADFARDDLSGKERRSLDRCQTRVGSAASATWKELRRHP